MFDDTSPFETVNGTGLERTNLQRAKGQARCKFKVRDNRTVLDVLGQSGSIKVRLPKLSVAHAPEAVLLNTAGGLTGGDHMSFTGDIAAGGHAIFTTQAAERAYRVLDGNALVETRLSVEEGGFVEWLPQETILFDGSRLKRSFDVDLAPGAKLLAHESVIFGRAAMGETVTSGTFRDVWRVRRNGTLVHADAVSVNGNIDVALGRAATFNSGKAMSTVLYVAEDALAKLWPVRDVIAHSDADVGVSAWNGKLVCRIIAIEGAALRHVVEPILTTIRNGRALPRVWHI